MFCENIRLPNFIPCLSRIDTYQLTITIFLYVIHMECVPPPAPKNNTLERWEVHLNDLLYLFDIMKHPSYQVSITIASMARLVELDFHTTILCNMPIINILGVNMMSICPHRWEQMHLYEKLTNDRVICLNNQTLIY